MKITDYEKCIGCSLCEFSCPKRAIKMKVSTNKDGFKYPVIDKKKCVSCKKCVLTCTANKQTPKNFPFRYEIAQNNVIEELNTTTSGGVSTSLAKTFVQNLNGVVYGVSFDENLNVRHIRCETLKECDKLKGSKYVQSDMSTIHSLIQTDLKNERYVLFIGTPCQCASMQLFKKYSNFYMCDLLCNGVGSPIIFNKHIKYLETKYKSKIINYIFRPKSTKYLEEYELAIFKNKTSVKLTSPWEKWGTIYYNSLAMRDSCYSCNYTSTDRVGDVTLSDIPKKLIESCKLKEDICRYGATYISVNTQKGELLTELIHEKCSYDEVEGIQKLRTKEAVSKPKLRNDFLMLCQEKSIEAAKLKVFGKKLKFKSVLIKLKNKFK